MSKSNQLTVWIVAASVALGGAAMAQSSAPCKTPVALGAIVYGPIPKTGAPYSATVMTTHDQTLADGSVVHSSVTTYQARDAAGRTWEKRSLGCQPGTDGERQPVQQVLVYDPGAQTSVSWKVDDPAKVYRSVHTVPVGQPLPKPDMGQGATGLRAMEQMGIHAEDLGSKTIAGIVADGTRFVTTVPASQTGSGHATKIVDETWVAEGPNLAVLNMEDNPRTGRTTVEVVDLKLNEPDPALFAPPAGYTLMGQSPTASK